MERCLALSQLGYDVDVIAPAGSRVVGASRVIGITQVRLREMRSTGNLLADFPRFLYNSSSLSYLKAYTDLGGIADYDFVINDAYRAEPWTTLLMANLLGWSRSINVLHGNMPRWSWVKPKGRLKRFHFGALNSHCADYMKSRGWSTYHFPNGISIPARSDIVRNPEQRLVFVGRITREKGVHLAIKIAKLARLKLAIYGKIQDPAYHSAEVIPRLSSDEVRFYGNRPRSELDLAIRTSLALVFTSTYNDPYPAVLLEAIRFGVPILGIPAGWYSGFHDVCNSRNSVIRPTVEEAAAAASLLPSLDRFRIHEDAERAFGWRSVLQNSVLPAMRKIQETVI